MTDANLKQVFPPRVPSTPPSDTFVSYAQNGEDVMLYRALGGVERGCYVDVGAGEPEADSVTCAFYQRGWRGINLEPAPGSFERLAAARPCDTNLNIAAGDSNGMTSFFLVDGGNGLSTAAPAQIEILRQQGWQITEIHVPVRTLTSIFEEHVGCTVHFLKIDVEGSERAVLTGMDLHRFRPWIVLIEATSPNSKTPTHRDWEDMLLDADYHFVWFDGLNRFYLSAEKAQLASAFQVQPNVFDGFVRHTEAEAHAQLALAQNCLSDAAARERRTKATLEEAQSELAAQRGRLEELNLGVLHLQEERDAWMQELFEADRFAAYLTQVRQTLLDDMKRLEVKLKRQPSYILMKYGKAIWKASRRQVRAVATLLGRP